MQYIIALESDAPNWKMGQRDVARGMFSARKKDPMRAAQQTAGKKVMQASEKKPSGSRAELRELERGLRTLAINLERQKRERERDEV